MKNALGSLDQLVRLTLWLVLALSTWACRGSEVKPTQPNQQLATAPPVATAEDLMEVWRGGQGDTIYNVTAGALDQFMERGMQVTGDTCVPGVSSSILRVSLGNDTVGYVEITCSSPPTERLTVLAARFPVGNLLAWEGKNPAFVWHCDQLAGGPVPSPCQPPTLPAGTRSILTEVAATEWGAPIAPATLVVEADHEILYGNGTLDPATGVMGDTDTRIGYVSYCHPRTGAPDPTVCATGAETKDQSKVVERLHVERGFVNTVKKRISSFGTTKPSLALRKLAQPNRTLSLCTGTVQSACIYWTRVITYSRQ
jgi:hypothetical protein